MSVTGSFFRTVLPPSFSTFFNVASMSATSTVMTVFLTSLFRFVSPPLIAPGAVGCRVFWSTSVVPTMWYSIPGYLLMSHPKGFLVEGLCAFLVVGRYLKVYDPSVMHILHVRGGREICLINTRYTFLPLIE